MIVLSDVKKTESGCAYLRDSEGGFNLKSFTSASWSFARDTGLATNKMEEVMASISGIGHGSMQMLGNAIFAFGDPDRLEETLKKYGQVMRARIYPNGAVMLKS